MTFATEGPKVPENSGLQERHAKAGCERKEESRIHRKHGNNRSSGLLHTTTENLHAAMTKNQQSQRRQIFIFSFKMQFYINKY